MRDSYRDNHRPRELRLFVNGDRYFRGKKIYLTPNRYCNFSDLLSDLTGKLPSNINLPYGVRQIFTPLRGRKILDKEDLLDGQTYVCAGFEGFKIIKYGKAEPQHWSMAISQPKPMPEQELDRSSGHLYMGASNAFHPGRYFRSNQSHPQRRWSDRYGTNQRGPHRASLGDSMDKAKVITIIRTGRKPRSNIKIIINRRSVQSYEQLIAHISNAFWPESKNNKVQKLFSARGKEVMGISDFFRGDDLFLAVGVGDADLSECDIGGVLEEMFPDDVVKILLQEWKRNERSRRKVNSLNQFVKSNKGDHVVSQVGNINSSQVADKRDSGFDSAEVSTNRSEPEQIDRNVLKSHRRLDMEKESVLEHNRLNKVDSQSETRRSYELPSLKKVGRERLLEGNEENEKLKWWRKNIMESDKKIGIVNRRKRVLVPLRNIDNRLRKPDDFSLKEVNMGHTVKGDEMRVEEERVEINTVPKDLENNESVNADNRIIESANEDRNNLQVKKDESLKCLDETLVKDKNNIIEVNEKTDKKYEHYIGRAIYTTETDVNSAQLLKVDQNKEQEVIASIETSPACKLPSVDVNSSTVHLMSSQHEMKDKVNNNLLKEKRKQDREDQQQRKRAKTKIVRKTKLERQVGNDEYVLAQFELGRKLGDGNFAIVRQSRKVESGQEFAIKVIDKAKLKGKDHMVENEIDILKDCCHHNIVRLYEEYETREKIYLVMELVKGGDLFECITQNVRFRETDSAIMIRDVCNALFYMHSRSIVHRDLKPENLLVHRSKEGAITLKLADFGLAMEVTGPIYTVCGTPTYVAPEILADKGYGLEVDMWAVGVITYILLCGFPPFRSPDRNQSELFEFIKAGYFEFLSPYWDNISRNAKDLINHLLVVDRKKRYNAVDVLCHKWILCCGQTDVLPDGAISLDGAIRDTRRELDGQAKLNYESYQRLKKKKKQELERKDEK